MKQELMHFTRVNSNLALIVEDLRMRQRGLNRELAHMKSLLQEQIDTKKAFISDVIETQHVFNDFKNLKKSIIRLYKVWVLTEGGTTDSFSSDAQRGYKANRKRLEDKYTCFKTKQKTTLKNHKEQNKRIISENVYLITEINTLTQRKHKVDLAIKSINSDRPRAESATLGRTTGLQTRGSSSVMLKPIIGGRPTTIKGTTTAGSESADRLSVNVRRRLPSAGSFNQLATGIRPKTLLTRGASAHPGGGSRVNLSKTMIVRPTERVKSAYPGQQQVMQTIISPRLGGGGQINHQISSVQGDLTAQEYEISQIKDQLIAIQQRNSILQRQFQDQ